MGAEGDQQIEAKHGGRQHQWEGDHRFHYRLEAKAAAAKPPCQRGTQQ